MRRRTGGRGGGGGGGYRTKNKNPTRQCGEQGVGVWYTNNVLGDCILHKQKVRDDTVHWAFSCLSIAGTQGSLHLLGCASKILKKKQLGHNQG